MRSITEGEGKASGMTTGNIKKPWCKKASRASSLGDAAFAANSQIKQLIWMRASNHRFNQPDSYSLLTHTLVAMRLWDTPVLIPNTMVKT